MHAYRDEAKARSAQLNKARDEIKRLYSMRDDMRKQLDEAAIALQAQEQGAVRELAVMKLRKRADEERHRNLLSKYEALKAELKACHEAAPQAASPHGKAMLSSTEHDSASEVAQAETEDEARRGVSQVRLNLGCWSWLLVCVPDSSQTQPPGML